MENLRMLNLKVINSKIVNSKLENSKIGKRLQFKILILTTVCLSSCSHPIVPEGKNVKVSRDDAGNSCREIGKVQGSLIGTKPDLKQAIEDMKKDAANNQLPSTKGTL